MMSESSTIIAFGSRTTMTKKHWTAAGAQPRVAFGGSAAAVGFPHGIPKPAMLLPPPPSSSREPEKPIIHYS